MSKPILIATLLAVEGETGVQTHFRALYSWCLENRLAIDTVTPYSWFRWQVYPVFALRKLIDPLNKTASVWWYRYWHTFFLQRALVKRLSSGEPCTIYAQCPLSAKAALQARVSPEQRVMLVVHFNISQALEWEGKKLIAHNGRLFRSIEKTESETLPQLDGLVFVSDFMRRELTGRIPAIMQVKTAVIPNFLPDPGLPPHQPIEGDLISIGTLERRKNQTYLLDIIAASRDAGFPLSLTLVGNGPDLGTLMRKARALKLEGLIHFAGYINAAAEKIGSHRATIHVATIENLPLVLIESLARGRPIFAAPVGGVPEILGDCSAGIAIPSDDPELAAQLIAKTLANSEWMAAAGKAARSRFLAEYYNPVVATRLVKFLDGTEVLA